MKNPRFIFLFHYATGLMDVLTGILLILAPAMTLKLMQVTPRDEAPELVSYIGVFVFAVGGSHFLAGAFPTDQVSRERWRTIWKTSALVRFSVAAYVTVKVVSQVLEPRWLSVAITDCLVASVLLLLLCRQSFDQP